MSSINPRLQKLINQRAQDGFTKSIKNQKDITKDNWYAFWFKTAAEVKAEFEKEGLIQTVKAVEQIIKMNKEQTGWQSPQELNS